MARFRQIKEGPEGHPKVGLNSAGQEEPLRVHE